ncbi:MAG TPA: Calx-beta domain-containing protein, partial [Mycobacteriales bacterium]|nr:Calx-beta domain-containing protein [Mycobacteriales bacterium]
LDGDNVISGNSNKGIGIDNASGNLITGNFIGTKANGTDALGNGGAGVSLYDATDNIVGFDINDFGAANTIAFNAGAGVEVETGTVAPGTGNVIRRNSVHGNGALGIDLAPNGVTGVTPNDAGDSDTGPNNLQNFPVITGATVAGATRHINGTLNSTPGQAFTIDFYANPAGSCDPSGNGEGQTYLGSATTAATDGNGDVSFTFNPPSLTPGDVITATATDAAGNTSEFSACFNAAAGSPGQIQFTDATYAVAENGASAAITFTRSGGQDGAVFATFSTSDGTANAPGDYTATTADVSYADGESGTKTINVPINDDTTYEGDETVSLSLTATTLDAPPPPASPAQSTATLTISENDAAPTLSIDDVTHNEGDAGTTSYVFTVTKSGSTALDASV